MNDALLWIQHSLWLKALEKRDESAMKNLIDNNVGFSSEFTDTCGSVLGSLVKNNLPDVAVYALRKHDNIRFPDETFECFLRKPWRDQIELAIEIFTHSSAKPESKIIETLLLTGFRCPEDLTTHLTKDNTLLKTAIELLTQPRSREIPRCTPKKIYRLRKIFYRFITPNSCISELFELLPRTDKFLRFEFNLTKVHNAICGNHLKHISTNKYICYHYMIGETWGNIMADRQYLPEYLKCYARILFKCNLRLQLPNEVLYLILEKLL